METGPRTRGHEPRDNDELWIAVFNLCEEQGRRWTEVQQAIIELAGAETSEQVAAILVPLLAYDPAREVVHHAAVKDALKAIHAAQGTMEHELATAREVLAGIERGLTRSVGKAVATSRRRRRETKYLPCPVCFEDKAAQGLPNHLRGTHDWTNDDIERWKERRDAERRLVQQGPGGPEGNTEQLPQGSEDARTEQASAPAA